MSQVYVFTQFGGPETENLINRPVPQLGPGELAVEVRAAGVTPSDWKTRSGRYGTDQPRPVPWATSSPG